MKSNFNSLKTLFFSSLLTLCLISPLLGQGADPEEPDFAFLAGGPYTQGKHVAQWIAVFNYGRLKGTSKGLFADSWTNTLRTEWGFTDRWEADFIIGRSDSVERTAAGRFGERGWEDTVAGIRYRLLNEESHPFTLTLGPQVILPTSAGSEWSYALDVASAKDWGGPVFMYASLNYHATPGVETSGLRNETTLHGVTWGTSLGIRAFEQRPEQGARHDVHAFVELAGQYEQDLRDSLLAPLKVGRHALLFAPGVRWGLTTAREDLFEFGVSAPIGLNKHASDWGIIFQLQIEIPFK